MLNVGLRTVQRAADVIENAPTEIVSAVERGEMSVSAAAATVSAPVDVQAIIAEQVASGEVFTAAQVKAMKEEADLLGAYSKTSKRGLPTSNHF